MARSQLDNVNTRNLRFWWLVIQKSIFTSSSKVTLPLKWLLDYYISAGQKHTLALKTPELSLIILAKLLHNIPSFKVTHETYRSVIIPYALNCQQILENRLAPTATRSWSLSQLTSETSLWIGRQSITFHKQSDNHSALSGEETTAPQGVDKRLQSFEWYSLPPLAQTNAAADKHQSNKSFLNSKYPS